MKSKITFAFVTNNINVYTGKDLALFQCWYFFNRNN